MWIDSFRLPGKVLLAPMAGVTDRPFRQLCKSLGAGMVVSEMISSNLKLRNTTKTRLRMDHISESEPISVQIAGSDPKMMSEAARFNVSQGAQIIDINMGCPAKKVCNKLAGSALLNNESLVAKILEAVVVAVDVPVTLKIRTGSDPTHRNGENIARIAESVGIRALAVHGRTRTCGYKGTVEYDTIKRIKKAISIPVIANGDITTPQKAKKVLGYTGADAVMVGRIAQVKPWIFGQINQYLESGRLPSDPGIEMRSDLLIKHLKALYDFYGERSGVRIARKHIFWQIQYLPGSAVLRQRICKVECAKLQLNLVKHYFHSIIECGKLAA